MHDGQPKCIIRPDNKYKKRRQLVLLRWILEQNRVGTKVLLYLWVPVIRI